MLLELLDRLKPMVVLVVTVHRAKVVAAAEAAVALPVLLPREPEDKAEELAVVEVVGVELLTAQEPAPVKAAMVTGVGR